MENGFQYVLLVLRALPFALMLLANLCFSADTPSDDAIQAADIDTEFFELGVTVGIISIDNFTSEPVLGVGAKFHATEDLFLQFTYGEAKASLSSFESSQGSFFSGFGRNYRYSDLLVGYNLLLGEVFPRSTQAYLSSLYLVAGVGATEFGNEENFTFVAGIGYRVGIMGGLVWAIDVKDHVFQSALVGAIKETTHNIEFSTGVSFLF